MRAYAVAMSVHMLGLVALFGGFILQHRTLARLRAATGYADARLWAELLIASRPMIPGGALMLLLSGGYLSRPLWRDLPVWIHVATAAVLFIGVVGLVVARQSGRIATALRSGEGPVMRADRAPLSSGPVWGLHAAANGAALGSIWLMSARPEAIEGSLVVAVPALVGATIGARLATRHTLLAGPPA